MLLHTAITYIKPTILQSLQVSHIHVHVYVHVHARYNKW